MTKQTQTPRHTLEEIEGVVSKAFDLSTKKDASIRDSGMTPRNARSAFILLSRLDHHTNTDLASYLDMHTSSLSRVYKSATTSLFDWQSHLKNAATSLEIELPPELNYGQNG